MQPAEGQVELNEPSGEIILRIPNQFWSSAFGQP